MSQQPQKGKLGKPNRTSTGGLPSTTESKKEDAPPLVPLEIVKTKQFSLFSHLPQFEHDEMLPEKLGLFRPGVHRSFVQLALQLNTGAVRGSTDRRLALLKAIRDFISDYICPPLKQFSRDIAVQLNNAMEVVKLGRQLSVSQETALKAIKQSISDIGAEVSEADAKRKLLHKADDLIAEVQATGETIAKRAVTLIKDGDVILTYARSRTVLTVLNAAKAAGKSFRVIVVDARPHLEGQSLLESLVKVGIPCTYAMVNALTHVISGVTKVVIGAHAMLANGGVLARAGMAMVAMMAKSHTIPVIVCCETYKFTERVQLDAICFNELANPDDLLSTRPATDDDPFSTSSALRTISDVKCPPSSLDTSVALGALMATNLGGLIPSDEVINAAASASSSSSSSSTAGSDMPSLARVGSMMYTSAPEVAKVHTESQTKISDWRDIDKLKLLNLTYDVTPADFVYLVATEVGLIPPTAVPVVLREYESIQKQTKKRGHQ